MARSLNFILRLAAYAAFAIVIAYFSRAPEYHYASQDMAVIKVSVSHATQHVEPCITLTPEEVAQLAPNMRNSISCARKRVPLRLELDVDGKTVLHVDEPASGLWGDGPALVYRRFELPAGSYRLVVRLRDSRRTEGWDYRDETVANLIAGRYFTVRFRPENEGFVFR